MSGEEWIYAHNWEKWQSGRRQEGAPWIRNYGALLQNDKYLDLSPTDRGVLHGVWMLIGFAGNGRLLRQDVRISARLSVDARTLKRSLDRLNDAGWISFECTKRGHSVFTRVEKTEEKEPSKALSTPPPSEDQATATDLESAVASNGQPDETPITDRPESWYRGFR